MSHPLLIYHPELAALHERLARAGGYPGPVAVASAPAEAAAHLPTAEVILTTPQFPKALLPRAVRLRWIESVWAGVESWLADPLPPGVVLTRGVGPYGPIMAEYVMAHLLRLSQDLDRVRDQQRARRWAPWAPRTLAGRCLGVLGIGAIGGAVACLARAFRMDVWGLSRSGRAHESASRTFAVADLHSFLSGCDVVVAVLPLTPETRGLLDGAAIRAMKAGAILVNIGRGPVVDEDALLAALDGGHLSHAVLDVFNTEPLPAEHPLWQRPNVTITPHIAGITPPEAAVTAFLANYRRFVNGEPLNGVVDPQRGY